LPKISVQTATARETLQQFDQQTLFAEPSPKIAPEPPIVDEATKEARRSEAQPRQHHTPDPATDVDPTPPPAAAASTPEPPPPTPVVEYEPLVTLSPFELIDHLKTVDRLEWAIENAPAHIDQLDTAITNLTSQRRELTQVRDQLLEERNTFAETSPLLFGVKKWEASLTQLDRVLDGHDQTLGRYGTQLDDLAGQRTNWTQYRSLTVQLEYGTAKTANTSTSNKSLTFNPKPSAAQSKAPASAYRPRPLGGWCGRRSRHHLNKQTLIERLARDQPKPANTFQVGYP